MLLNNARPRGLFPNKNAANIQASNIQQVQNQKLQLGGKNSKTPSPPQLKSLKQRSENDDLGQLLLNHQQQLKDLDQPLKPHQALHELQKPEALEEIIRPQAHDKEPAPAQQYQRTQGLKRERPKSLIPRLVSELAEREAKREEKVEDIDDVGANNDIFLVTDIAKDIYNYMFQLEDSMAIKYNFLSKQPVYKPKIRQRLIDWCIDIHNKLKLLPETMYTTISILDRYFQIVIAREQTQVQLVAMAATLIASKYEEIYPPEIEDLIHLSQNAYTKKDILRKEIEILETLKFDLGKPIPPAFLRRFSRAAHCDVKMHSIAKWFMETSIPYYECSHWKPSQLAATALFISIYLIHRDNTFACWTKTLIHYTNYTRQQLMEPAVIMCKLARQRVPPIPKYSELKQVQLDHFIKLGEQYMQQQQQQQHHHHHQ